MKQKHIIVTGGAKGIGACCVRLFAENSHHVTILDIDDEEGNKLAESLGDLSQFINCDVSDTDQVVRAVEKAIDRFGEISVLVNNAGINPYGAVTETSDELWDRVMNVNLKSHFICARECIPSMLRNGKGVVINVSSVQAFLSQQKVAAYTTSKTALLGLTRSIAVDYSPEIRSIAICPGTVDTPMLQKAIQESPNPEEVYKECEDMHLANRVADPSEIAELIFFASNEKAEFITGQAIRVDGGLGVMISGSKRND
ncbi:MAG: SDR family oxidoreductase [Balneolaceae bacterium]|nr:SDR family oxidoreductase [Balneolaceae bacterium]MDR9407323.1 SDR family oxidoreductase [Balneolaceae bacterium]